ncbi:MAG: protein kinase [Proteobacteria bacterium]|nr:protein kinase [Pseudomonadota bacterium]MCP4917982.1 protein kinase [Pseudomonadota bacterium]
MADDSRLTFGRGDVVSRKYEIENHLGDGVFGKTYLARHIASGKHVALKFVMPHLLEGDGAGDKLKKAFQNGKKVRHTGLVRYGEINEHNGLTYLVQEYFKSQSLRQVMDEYLGSEQAFTLQDACQIVIKVLEALQVGHDAGLIHRNLKPENILVHTQRSGPGGSKVVRTIKITDLGLVDMFDPENIGDRYSSDMDSPYLAPELSGYGSEGSPQADIYSVGTILYELLCGQVPRGTFLSPTQVREDLPNHVDHLVELGLSPDQGDRYPTAKDMVFDIQRSFNLEMQEAPRKTNLTNILIGIGIGTAVIALAGLYIAGRDPVDATLGKVEQDELVRKQVLAENPLPSDAIVQTMIAARPDMVWIPGGTYVSGRLHSEDGSMASPSEALARVTDVEDFYIDRYEFPNRPGQLPAGKVSQKDAAQACEDQGKRLCTSAEWEKACKGPGNYIYSYGDTWDATMCGGAMDEPYKLGGREQCVSGYGVIDMSGGFREWTGTTKGSGSRLIVKGGQRGNPERGARCAFSVDEAADYAESTLTFRCCQSIDSAGSEPAPAPAPEGEETE